MNFTINIETYTLNKTRLIERIQQCVHEREILKEQQQRHIKTYSIIHYIEYIKRCINDNPLISRALFRFYNTIKNFSLQDNQFSSTIISNNIQSKITLEDKISIDNLYKIDLSKINLTISQSTKSNTHFIQPSHQTNSLITKATLTAINKTPRQRTKDDIEVLEHLLNRCENLHHLSANIRHYIARSLFLLTYHPNTILTRQNYPSFLVYIIIYGQCKLLFETNQTIIFGHQLNIGDIYGDDSLQSIINYRLNGLITNDCKLIGFFSRDIRAYENYLSDMMKQLLLEQFRIQSTFIGIQWRNDILNYFLKYTNYKQYSINEIIYGNEEYEHKNIYFILNGQVSFVCLLDFPSIIIKYPEFYQKKITKTNSKLKSIWRFIEVFILSNGHYFGFESTTIHSWYLTQSIVDIISIPKNHFKEFGYFAPMIFEKLRQDFLDIYPNKIFIRNLYIKYLKTIQLINHKKQSNINNHNINFIQKIPEQNILSIKTK